MRFKFLAKVFLMVIAFLPMQVKGEESISLRMSGRLDILGGVRKQSHLFNYVYIPFSPTIPLGEQVRNTLLINDAMLKFEGQGVKGDNKIGAFLAIHANTSKAATNQEQSIADKTMVYFQNTNIGRFEFGNYPSATAVIEAEHFNVNVGGYGTEGYWSRFINSAIIVDGTIPAHNINAPPVMLPDALGLRYLISPNLPSNYSGNHYSDALKFSFLTQLRADTIFGISYIDDLDDSGTLAGITNRDSGPKDAGRNGFRPTFRNIISVGVRHEKLLAEKLKRIFTFVTEFGRAKLAPSDNNLWYYGNFYLDEPYTPFPTSGIRGIRAYEVGLILKDDHRSISSTYGNWGKTGTYKKNAGFRQDAKYWTITGQYHNDDIKYSLGYMNSRRAGGLETVYSYIIASNNNFLGGVGPWPSPGSDVQDNKMRVISFSTELQSIRQFTPFAEVNFFKFQAPHFNELNRGVVGIIGARIRF